jgi:uncharacterized membrane protein
LPENNLLHPLKPSVSNKRLALAVIFFVPAVILLALPFYTPGDVPYLMLTIGRFHPVILHFPIVLIIVAMILELLRRSKMLRKADYIITIILVAAALSAVVAIASGYLLYASGDYSGSLLQRHLWLGVITGISILVTSSFYFLSRNSKRFYPFYFATLLISNGAVAYTSHLGGALTHGENYLSEYLPLIRADVPEVEVKAESEMLVYDDVIVPVFEAKCMGCHNDSRSKGELSMVSLQNIVKGGESGAAGIVPGIADSSELYRRLILPEEDDERMPPKGKTPLTASETALVKLWINAGANTKVRVEDVRADSTADAMVKEILPQLKRYRRRQQIADLEFKQLQQELNEVARRLNITIEPDTTADENLFAVTMRFPPAPLSNSQLRELAPYAKMFSKLSLVASGIEDDGLYHIGKMENVKSLFLQKTKLNGTGLVHLQQLQNLEVLNLSFTDVDDKAVLDLLKIPNLREVYLYRTKASTEVIKALQEYRPSLRILIEEGPYL